MLLLLVACGGRGCAGCGDESLAVLVSWQGQVQRDHSARVGQFTTAEHGARFDDGDGLRTLASAQARLQLRGASYVLVQADTTIRFWRGAKRGLSLKVQTGAANVVADQGSLELETEFGMAVLQPGSQLRIRPSQKGQRYEVTLGRAMLVGPDGQQTTLQTGEGVGTPLAASATPPATPAPPEPAPAPAPAPASAELLALQGGHGPADIALPLGSSLAMFDPKPPSAVDIDVRDSCPKGALLSVRGRAPMRISDRETVMFGAGSHDYKLACLDAKQRPGPAKLHGTLQIVRNAGTAQLPRSAPKNSIETDGRTYTIMFQNLLPTLEVRWPQAPQADKYNLEVALGTGRQLQVALTKPVHVFTAGALPEGSHKLRFTADASGTPRSKQTTVELRFDNASPTASLRSPDVSGFEPGTSVHVAGIALPGSQVSVLGQRLALDAQQRFAGDIAIPVGTHAIAVRIAHPRTGARYYIRRVRSSP